MFKSKGYRGNSKLYNRDIPRNAFCCLTIRQMEAFNSITTKIFKEMHHASVSIIASILDNTVAAKMDV